MLSLQLAKAPIHIGYSAVTNPTSISVRIFLLLVLTTLVCNFASGAVTTYKFSGTVIFVPPKSQPYGLTIPNLSPVNGQFQYETDTLAAAGSTNSIATYQQSITNGFTATIGGVLWSASSYNIKVSNDFQQPNGTTVDMLTIRFASDDTPSPSQPLTVNGLEKSTGILSINLAGNASVFSSAALPSLIALNSFPTRTNLLCDQPTGSPILFSVNSLVPVPEPGSALLFAVGVSFFCLRRYRS